MNNDQQIILEAITRGRLIFPFRDEMLALQEEKKQGPLLESEAEQLQALEAAYEKMQGPDKEFHAAVEREDWEGAKKAAEAGLAIVKGVAD